MSRTTSESDDYMHSNNCSGSPAADVVGGCGHGWDGSLLKKGPWTSAEDAVLIEYVKKHGEGNWNAVQKHTGLSRCGKSCRLRWANHLRPNLKKGAFSQEEEQLIIELHAKMGNKWARMAAHLPGRTDNEIKNYWNTRIKRRQRAGLPLYPPEMHVQLLQRNLDCGNSEVLGPDKIHQGFLQSGSCEPSIFFDNLKAVTGMVPSGSELSDISACNMLDGASSSQYKSFMPPITRRPKRLRVSEALFPGCRKSVKDERPSPEHFQDRSPPNISGSLSFSFPSDLDPPDRNQNSSSMIMGSHTLMNGIFPASKPTLGTVKLELPSFQYPETNFDEWNTKSSPPSDLFESVDAFIQSPPISWKLESDCFSSSDSGLLDMLLHEAKIRSSTKSILQSSEKSFSSSTLGGKADVMTLSVPESKSKEYEDPLKPVGHCKIPTFSESMQICASGSSSGESPSLTDVFIGDNLKSEAFDGIWTPKREKESTPVLDMTRPDVLLASSWLEPSSGLVKETATMTDALAAVLCDDIGSEYMHVGGGGGTSSSGQARALGTFAWSNMPPVCQMTELP